MTRARVAAVGAVALLAGAAGCQEAPVRPLAAAPASDSAPPPPSTAPDAGPLPPPPPPRAAGPAPVPRRLVRWSPTGTLPPDNLVLNPRLDVVSAVAPQGLVEPPRQYVWPRTPASQPVLRVAVRDVVAVLVQARPGPLDARVWIGRPEADPRLFAEISLAGWVSDGPEPREVRLVPDDGGEVPMNGVVWRRFGVRTPPGFVGHLRLLVENRAEQPLYVHGPVVRPATRALTGRGQSAAAPAGRFDAPIASRRAALEAFAARDAAAARERLAPPSFERR